MLVNLICCLALQWCGTTYHPSQLGWVLEKSCMGSSIDSPLSATVWLRETMGMSLQQQTIWTSYVNLLRKQNCAVAPAQRKKCFPKPENLWKLFRASCLKLEISEFRCYEVKIEESEKGRQTLGVEPRTPLAWAASTLPLSHDRQTTTNPRNPLYVCICSDGTY